MPKWLMNLFHSLGRKQAAKRTGIAQIPTPISAEAQGAEYFNTLVNAGLKPEDMSKYIKSEKDIIRLLNRIKHSEEQSITRQFGKTTDERFNALEKHLEKRDTLFGPEKATVTDLAKFKDKKGIKSIPVDKQFTKKPNVEEVYFDNPNDPRLFKPKSKVAPIKKNLSDDEATSQINKLREDFNFNDRKQVLQLFDDIDAGKAFGAFDDVQKKELRDMISKMYTEKPKFAFGGLAKILDV